jgi:hypothetical protein
VNLQRVHTNQSEYYSLGIDEETKGHVLEVVITWVAWYSRFFKLTKEEFEAYPANQVEIDELARSCAGANGITNNRERFICSQKSEENR